MATYVGKPLKRFEDPRLVTGQGTFVDDLHLPGMLHAVVLTGPLPGQSEGQQRPVSDVDVGLVQEHLQRNGLAKLS